MNLRTSVIATLSLIGTVALPLQPALGQSDQQCTLKTVTEALNNLGCAVSGAYVSADSVVAIIRDTCAPTADAETCHACFRKAGGKVGPVFKALAKVKILTKANLSQFRVALVTAEEATCAPKDTEETSNETSGEDSSAPSNLGDRDSGARGRGRDDVAGPRTEKPERPERPERRR